MTSIIFDYDGVLVNSFDFHLGKINELYDVSLTREEYKNIHDGNFFHNKLKKLEGINFNEYAHTVASQQAKLPLEREAENTLLALAKTNKLFLITSGWRVQVVPFLKNHNILHFFTRCLFADDGKTKHEKLLKLLSEQNINANECYFVTDTLGDIVEANQLNIKSIAVTFGYHDKERLMKGSPSYIAESWAEVREILQNQ